MAPAKPVKKITDIETIKGIIRETMFRNNTPQTYSSMITACGSRFSKTYGDRAIAQLLEEGSLVECLEGRAKCVMPSQEPEYVTVMSDQEMAMTVQRTEGLKKRTEELEEALKEAKQRLHSLTKEGTVTELRNSIHQRQTEIDRVGALIDAAGGVTVTEEDMKAQDKRAKELFSMWSKRKMAFMDVLLNLADGKYECKKQNLADGKFEGKKQEAVEGIGLDMDEITEPLSCKDAKNMYFPPPPKKVYPKGAANRGILRR
ncbi:tat binding protein 1-interacting protein [Kipferlia bialata]|uniref:Tat binding protein 1-interacting protein n=1 Tax=Kipferlia bialata TaxID=797122 RepID=A0A9K3GKL9_9EUKA|nr:tat binding protein 1-interacting protein [Kipferlia bialata]|eukprot:g7478.t1